LASACPSTAIPAFGPGRWTLAYRFPDTILFVHFQFLTSANIKISFWERTLCILVDAKLLRYFELALLGFKSQPGDRLS
jgi:hypothetical protein